jgi:hypothetical protein
MPHGDTVYRSFKQVRGLVWPRLSQRKLAQRNAKDVTGGGLDRPAPEPGKQQVQQSYI